MSETTPRREATRQRLLQAAMGEFARHGIDATSVEQISEAAGFTRGAFYSNFEDKDALILALLEETHRATMGRFQVDVANLPEKALDLIDWREANLANGQITEQFEPFGVRAWRIVPD